MLQILELAHFPTDLEMLDLSNRYKMEPLFERELSVVDTGINDQLSIQI